MNKVEIKSIDFDNLTVIRNKYDRIDATGVNHGRAIYFDSKKNLYYKIFHKDYVRRENFEKALSIGFFEGMTPALESVIYDDNIVVGYVSKGGKILSDSEFDIHLIPDDFTEKLLDKIKETKMFFYDFEKKDGLYNSENIYERIRQNYKSELNEVTEDRLQVKRIEDGILLEDQTFIDKTGQTVKWTRDVVFKYKLEQSYGSGSLGTSSLQNILGLEEPKPEVVNMGRSRFRVHWQHQISTKGKISRPKVTDIEFVGNELDNSERDIIML